MSKTHPYRIQLHCNQSMHKDINIFAESRGLSQSAAARILVERALMQKSDEVTTRFDKMEGYLSAILHASSVTRVLAADAAKKSGSEISGDELRERVSHLLQRYKKFGS